MVSEVDLGVNFFLDDDCLGLPRAECCAERLLELNPDVQGDWYPKSRPRAAAAANGSKKMCIAGADQVPVDLSSILGGQSAFTVVLYTLPIQEEHLNLIEAYGKAHSTPVISVHSAGFSSYFQVTLPDVHPVVDTHPDDTATMDLRLVNPWKELADFCSELTEDIDDLDNHDHGHLPFVAILAHYLSVWKGEHGSLPSTYPEKVAFRKLVSEGMRKDTPEGGEENFEEAIAAVLKAVSAPGVPSTLREVFEFDRSKTVGSNRDHDIGRRKGKFTWRIDRVERNILGHRRWGERILRQIRPATRDGRPPRHEGQVRCLHPASEHLQGQGPGGCSRGVGPNPVARCRGLGYPG